MRATTVRFDDSLWSLLEREARESGVSAAQFVRDAAILRLAVNAAQRGDEAATTTLEDVAAGALRRRGGTSVPLPDLPAVGDPRRLRALQRSGLLGIRDDPAFDRLTRMATRVLGAPVALVSLVDRDRQVFASCLGLPEPWATRGETPLSHSFCQHAVDAREPLVVEDAREHPLLRTNLAIRDLGVVAYAGIPLIDDDGHALGTLCVIDDKPRRWTAEEIDLLRDLASSVMSEIRLRAR
jgi:GAF domain-containing protein